MSHRSTLSGVRAMPLYVPLLAIALLLLATTTMLTIERVTPAMRPVLVVAGDTPVAAGAHRPSPFGSGAAVCNLLY